MPKTQGLFLTDIGNVDHVRNLPNQTKQVSFTALRRGFLQFVPDVEMIFDGLLTATSDNNDLFATCREILFDSILKDWLIDQSKHFFWLRLRCWQKPSAEACRWDDGL